jgi:hypothetical protein
LVELQELQASRIPRNIIVFFIAKDFDAGPETGLPFNDIAGYLVLVVSNSKGFGMCRWNRLYSL